MPARLWALQLALGRCHLSLLFQADGHLIAGKWGAPPQRYSTAADLMAFNERSLLRGLFLQN